MGSRFHPSIVHAIGCIVAAAIAVVLLLTVLPEFVSRYFPQPGRLVSLRGEGVDFLFLAASIYRIAAEPNVLPSLVAWAEREGIEMRPGVEQVLVSLRSPPQPAPAETPAPSKPEDPPA